MVSGPRYGSSRASTRSGRTIAARIAPTIIHRSQLGKFAPAIVTIGSHAVKETIDKHAASLRALVSRDDRSATRMSLHKRVALRHTRRGFTCSRMFRECPSQWHGARKRRLGARNSGRNRPLTDRPGPRVSAVNSRSFHFLVRGDFLIVACCLEAALRFLSTALSI